MLWEIDLHPKSPRQDLAARAVAEDARALGLADDLQVAAAHGYLLQADHLDQAAVEQLSEKLFADAVVEEHVVAPPSDPKLHATPERLHGRDQGNGDAALVYVVLKPGVMDPVARSAEAAIADAGQAVDRVGTLRKYWLTGVDRRAAEAIAARILANDAVEQTYFDELPLESLELGQTYQLERKTVPIRTLDDDALMELSRTGQLYLQLPEMQTIQRQFNELDRDPTDIELETIAQTWSEHCSHKTLAGRIAYRDERGEQHFENMLRETIFAATDELRRQWGDDDWCVSVFRDNAGVVRFDREHNITFKVETHNHPSALEPYGGANTGVGGVIRDTIGTGLGAKPIAGTDVFCFAPPDTPAESLPPGVLHPKLVIRGVVEGVRDYGNRMGIPTVNGAVYFDPRYLGNPLVYCGSVGLLPHDKSFGDPQPGDLIVAVGGRTGRDGIHGATFSSAELTSESETLSGGAVQIGNAIEEKKVLDVILAARTRGLFTAITDCGAGGFSSAVGEMGEEIGAEVWLERAPLKYAGLSYTEIWISEAQERMVLSVPESAWESLEQLCRSEDVEATMIGRFVPTGRLALKYAGETVGDLSMKFLHDGRPPTIRQAVYAPPPAEQATLPIRDDYTEDLLKILGSLNVASKHWLIRQYDHEVQGGSVVKPLVGPQQDGPSDAAVLRPVLDSMRGIVISCGMNPHYGDYDPYDMAASAIDEALRNCVAVGADPSRIAILDNFCWGDCERNETLGSLVRAALACRDLSLVFETPFISGKDSLNNEFSYLDSQGNQQTIAIPPTLLISALGQIVDVRQAVTMDFKQPGNWLYLIGQTHDELGGSHFTLVNDIQGGMAPKVDPAAAKQSFAALHRAIGRGLVAACHDLSEGGLATAAAEMAFAGGHGAELSLEAVEAPLRGAAAATEASAQIPAMLLFSESNSRFLCEVPAEKSEEFEACLNGISYRKIGHVAEHDRLKIADAPHAPPRIDVSIEQARQAWRVPLDW